MTVRPGAFRIVSPPAGSFLASMDLRIEVQQQDGTWLPLQCVTSATIDIQPNKPVVMTLGVLVDEIDIGPIGNLSVTMIRSFFPRRTWRQRAIDWWRDNLRTRSNP